MGSIMISSTGGQAGKKPVAAHPLFTAVVALWCAALPGLATLAVHPAALAAGLGQLSGQLIISRVVPAGAWAILSSQTILAATLAAIGCMAGIASAHLAKRLTAANKNDRRQDVLVMPEVPSLSLAAVQSLREPQVDREGSPEPAGEPIAATEPATTRLRPVLDIHAIDLTDGAANEPLELTAFINERQDQPVPIVDTLPARSREDTEQALRDALSALRQLRGAA